MASTKYLRILTALGFTTLGRTLLKQEYDSTLIGLKEDTDALALTVAEVSATTHEQNSDRYLQKGLLSEFDSKKFKRSKGFIDGKAGDNAVVFDDILPVFADDRYNLFIWGWETVLEDGVTVSNPVAISYKNKSVLGFTAIAPIACQISWMAFV